MGKYDLWNKNTKFWADKYNIDIIKTYLKKRHRHEFKITAHSIKYSNLYENFYCFAVNPQCDKEGKFLTLIGKDKMCYCVPGDNIIKFLDEYIKNILDVKYDLMAKYYSILRGSKRIN